MSIGMAPIIPLHQVQPDPDARLRRFGVNDSQLFGKPLVELVPEPRPASPLPKPIKAPVDKSAFPELFGAPGGAGQEPRTRVVDLPDAKATPGYLRASADRNGLGLAPRTGSLLDLEG